MTNPLKEDLDHILAHTAGLWEELRGQRIFITGGTGFFGCWLLESLMWANEQLGLGVEVTVLTRYPELFMRKVPHLANHPAVRLHAGDVRAFEFPQGRFSHVVHMATDASAKLNHENPCLMFETIVDGTRRTLEFARQCGAGKFLLASSGAVYGRQPPNMMNIPEDFEGAPNPVDPSSAYAEGKRVAELFCAIYAHQYGVKLKIARCFAFVGPGLSLDAHFAIGNFIRDALNGGPIRVKGDGTPLRSYLYAADLAIWLWTILIRGQSGSVYNVGSGEPVSIRDLAYFVGNLLGNVPVIIENDAGDGGKPTHYVPDVSRAASELALRPWIGLEQAVKRMASAVMADRARI